jgi:nucleoside-diphosphate-sugar epimerase
MTILRPNLVFGGPSHFVHLLTYIALSGKSPNSVGRGKHWSFQYAPIHSDDVATATADALEHSHKGSFALNGPEQLNIG